MKRIMLVILAFAMTLVPLAANAERSLMDVDVDIVVGFNEVGASAWISTSVVEGQSILEGRVLLHNVSEKTLRFLQATMTAVDKNGDTVTIDASAVTPKRTDPNGYALFTFSQLDFGMEKDDIVELRAEFLAKPNEQKEVYLGVGEGYFKPSEYTEGGLMQFNMTNLPTGLYDVNLVALDKDGVFMWGEDRRINTEDEMIASAGIEDYEIQMMRDAGHEIGTICAIVYRIR